MILTTSSYFCYFLICYFFTHILVLKRLLFIFDTLNYKKFNNQIWRAKTTDVRLLVIYLVSLSILYIITRKKQLQYFYLFVSLPSLIFPKHDRSFFNVSLRDQRYSHLPTIFQRYFNVIISVGNASKS